MRKLILMLALSGTVQAAPEGNVQKYSRVVSLGGAITETVFALGAGSRVVGVDLSSTYPAAAASLPQVGYHRTLSSEGVLSLKPDLILGTDEAGPPPVLSQLKSTGIPIILLPIEQSIQGAKNKIAGVAKALGVEAKGQELIQQLEQDLEKLRIGLKGTQARPRILFIYARGQNVLSVSGTNTAADALIGIAGGTNAVTGYEGYRPMTSESVVAASPDILLLPEKGLESIGGVDGLLKLPGLSLTPAGKARRVVAMDDLLLLGFGPRLGQAAWQIGLIIHPEIKE